MNRPDMGELPDEIEEAVQRLRDELDPEAIYLYGSYAYGSPGRDSDVDLLVVLGELEEPSHEAEARAYRRMAGLGLPFDIRVVDRETYQERSSWLSSIEREVRDRGVDLYGAA